MRPFRDIPIFERFPVLICVPFVWIYAVILTAGGAYRHKSDITQHSCRTDRANLISTAPWYLKKHVLISSNRFKLQRFCWFLWFLLLVLGSCSHILSNGVHLHFPLAIHLLWCRQLLSQWWRYLFSFLILFLFFWLTSVSPAEFYCVCMLYPSTC